MRSTDVVVAPPFVYIDQVKNSITDRIEISAQNSWVGKGGAFTGEIRLACLFLLSFTIHMSIDPGTSVFFMENVRLVGW